MHVVTIFFFNVYSPRDVFCAARCLVCRPLSHIPYILYLLLALHGIILLQPMRRSISVSKANPQNPPKLVNIKLAGQCSQSYVQR